MQKKLRITVEGKVYDVLVEELTENGYAAPTYPSIAGTGVPSLVAASPMAAPPPMAAAAPAVAGAGDEISPLAGMVESILVSVGQTVVDGDKIAVIEAMKMKTPVHAHRGGTVTAIAVTPGQAVDAGHVLLSIG